MPGNRRQVCFWYLIRRRRPLREIKFPVFLPETVHGAQVVIYICGLCQGTSRMKQKYHLGICHGLPEFDLNILIHWVWGSECQVISPTRDDGFPWVGKLGSHGSVGPGRGHTTGKCGASRSLAGTKESPRWWGHGVLEHSLSNERPGCLGFIGDCTTLFYWEYKKPL